MREVYVSFRDIQVAIRTNVSDVEQFVRESHSPMIAASAANVFRTIDVMKIDGGYTLGDHTFQVEGEPSMLFDLLRQTIQWEFIAAHDNIVWIHAGAAAASDQAVVIAGPSTAGKSTLIGALIENGLSYMTDELVGVRADATVTGYPRAPMKRKKSDRELTQAEMADLSRQAIHVPPGTIRREACMRAIVFARYKHGAKTELSRISSGDAAMRLFQTILNFDAQREKSLPTIASIARSVPAYSLTFSDAVVASQTILDAM